MFTFFLSFLLLFSCLTGSFGARTDFDTRFHRIIKPYSFSLVAWEINTLDKETIPSLFRNEKYSGDVSSVLEYFTCATQVRALNEDLDAIRRGDTNQPDKVTSLEAELACAVERKTALESIAERVIEKQIRDILTEEGIYNPFAGVCNFPPVDFKLAAPPLLLVVSPRDRIESMRETMLQPDLATDDMKIIEAKVDELNVSSLVTGIGGLGATYPTFVSNEMDLRSTINAATEEWLHQYLAFRPLGFRYVLDVTGLVQDYDIACMNETLAGIVSKEIGDLVYGRYYLELSADNSQQQINSEDQVIEFDFNREMRQIRVQVDLLLSLGKIDEAEEFMNQKRDYLESQGYYIRKLNQAYFAFYGTYADSPTSIDPIGTEMKKLRHESTSLKQFLDKVSTMTSREALENAAGSQVN
jgi:hypothetical protein